MTNLRDELTFKCLDHGLVKYIDHMGSDEDVLEAARVCYKQGGKSSDRTLLRYLMRHLHTTPFESGVIKIYAKLPIFVERQWVRHRTGGLNEVSARYSELPAEYYVPESLRSQSETNKQGSGDVISVDNFLTDLKANNDRAFVNYQAGLKAGVARELARVGLPVGTYTEKYWWCNVHNILHFLSLRLDKHAQYEVRVYAEALGKIVERLFPQTWEAFIDYRLSGIRLSRMEVLLVRSSPYDTYEDFMRVIKHYVTKGEMDESWILDKCRERDEAVDKLRHLGAYHV
jgi:thymidylate synthase (FAD)